MRVVSTVRSSSARLYALLPSQAVALLFLLPLLFLLLGGGPLSLLLHKAQLLCGLASLGQPVFALAPLAGLRPLLRAAERGAICSACCKVRGAIHWAVMRRCFGDVYVCVCVCVFVCGVCVCAHADLYYDVTATALGGCRSTRKHIPQTQKQRSEA